MDALTEIYYTPTNRGKSKTLLREAYTSCGAYSDGNLTNPFNWKTFQIQIANADPSLSGNKSIYRLNLNREQAERLIKDLTHYLNGGI